jgi:hypothetical protein
MICERRGGLFEKPFMVRSSVTVQRFRGLSDKEAGFAKNYELKRQMQDAFG